MKIISSKVPTSAIAAVRAIEDKVGKIIQKIKAESFGKRMRVMVRVKVGTLPKAAAIILVAWIREHESSAITKAKAPAVAEALHEVRRANRPMIKLAYLVVVRALSMLNQAWLRQLMHRRGQQAGV